MKHLVVVFVFAQAAALQATVELPLPCVPLGEDVQFDLLQATVQPSVAAPVLAGDTSDCFVRRFGDYIKTSARGYYHGGAIHDKDRGRMQWHRYSTVNLNLASRTRLTAKTSNSGCQTKSAKEGRVKSCVLESTDTATNSTSSAGSPNCEADWVGYYPANGSSNGKTFYRLDLKLCHIVTLSSVDHEVSSRGCCRGDILEEDPLARRYLRPVEPFRRPLVDNGNRLVAEAKDSEKICGILHGW